MFYCLLESVPLSAVGMLAGLTEPFTVSAVGVLNASAAAGRSVVCSSYVNVLQ